MPRTSRARPSDPDKVLADYDERYLMCRGINHPWRQIGFYRRGSSVVRRLMCPRCTSVREDLWDMDGQRLTQRYLHADGYLITGEGHVDRRDIRVAVIQRAKIFASEDAMTKAFLRAEER